MKMVHINEKKEPTKNNRIAAAVKLTCRLKLPRTNYVCMRKVNDGML